MSFHVLGGSGNAESEVLQLGEIAKSRRARGFKKGSGS